MSLLSTTRPERSRKSRARRCRHRMRRADTLRQDSRIRRLLLESLEDRRLLTIDFYAAPTLTAGLYPSSVTAVDLDADGSSDLAVANEQSNTVSIFRGNGDGTFQTPVSYGVGITPRSVTVGDFNADGRHDLAVANSGSNTVSILTGNGDGTFQAAVDVGAGLNPTCVTVEDFNADGKSDLVVANSGSNTVSILMGNGDGTFQTAVDLGAGSNPSCVTVSDFNADGKSDLAVANKGSSTISTLLGNGDGTFQAAVNVGVGSNPSSLTVGDFDADGADDLAVANSGSNTISMLRGNGDGTFQAALNFSVGTSPWSVAVGDFNGDGSDDLAVANERSNNVSILRGNGDGTFQTATHFGVGMYPHSVAVGDFNADGKNDLVVADNFSNTVSILRGNGDATFQSALSFGVGSYPSSVTVGDFDADGNYDLAVANSGSNTVSTLRGNGDGTFQAAVNFGVGVSPRCVIVGDFNADGKSDLVVANYSSNDVSILRGNGDGTFQPAENFGVGTNPWSVAAGDFDADGWYDLAVANERSNNVSVLRGNGDGTFQAAANVGVGTSPWSVTVGDFDADGKTDLVVANYGSNSVCALLGNGDGTFQAAAHFGVGTSPWSVTVGDFNADGAPDLAVANYGSRTVSVLRGNGDGAFQAAVHYGVGLLPRCVTVGDFNTDGRSDLAVANYGSNNVSILPGNGDGTFQAAVDFGVGSNPYSVAVGDFNADGQSDLAVANDRSNNVSILRNTPNAASTDVTLSHTSVAENQPVGTLVGTFATLDPDAGDTFSYALVAGEGDTDNSSFVIPVGSNELCIAASLDFETKSSYSIRVRSTDAGGLAVEKQFTITVTDVQAQSPFPVQVDPSGFNGQYTLVGDGTYFVGATTYQLAAGTYFLALNGLGTLPFSVDDDGDVTSSSPALVAGPDGSLRFNTTTVHVDPGAFAGAYDILSIGMLAPIQGDGNLTVVGGLAQSYTLRVYNIGSFLFTVDAGGTVTTSSEAAQASGSTLTLNTQTIHVDPGTFGGSYDILWVGMAVPMTGPGNLTVVGGLAQSYTLRVYNIGSFLFTVDAGGTVTTSSEAAQASGSTLTLNTQVIHVDTGAYAGGYDVLWTGMPTWVTGSHGLTVVAGLTQSCTLRLQMGGSLLFTVDASGTVSTSSAAAEAFGSTLTLNTRTIHIDPGAYTGFYDVLFVGMPTWVAGPNDVPVVAGLPQSYALRLAVGGSAAFTVDGDGVPTPSDIGFTVNSNQVTFVLSATDVDGVDGDVENGAPNNGDGNGDGILDSRQANVTSLPNARDGGYVTLSSPEGTFLENVQAIDNPSPSDTPDDVAFPVGFFAFTLRDVAPGASATVQMLLPADAAVGRYYQYGPTPENNVPHWYEFAFDGTTGAEINGQQVLLHFVDGQRGDHDLSVNGAIVDPGGPVALPPLVEFSHLNYAVGEDGAAIGPEVALTRTGNLDLASSVLIEYTGGTATGSGGDYDGTSIVVEFAPGETTRIFNVPVIQDQLVELDEVVAFHVTGVTNATADSMATLRIVNDDTATLVVHNAAAAEDGGAMTLTVLLSGDVDIPFTVDFATADGSAKAQDDYLPITGSLAFAGLAGETQTISVPLVHDTVVEFDEDVTITLNDPIAFGREAFLVSLDGRGTILNDDTFVEQGKLVASYGGPLYEWCGESVAVDGDYAVVGIPQHSNESGYLSGTVQVFRRQEAGIPGDPSDDTWMLEAQLFASDASAHDYFGASVSISGTTLVVGAYSGGDDDSGAAYVFIRSGNTWYQQQKIVQPPDDTDRNDSFGRTVSISGDTLIVGAPSDDNQGIENAGAIYVFTRSGSTWSQQQKLVRLAGDATSGDGFGSSASISGETLVVGAYLHNSQGLNWAGAAYVFTRNGSTWTQQQKLMEASSDAAMNDLFGSSVSISGDTLVVGAPNDVIQGIDSVGAAYVFVRSGSMWSQQQKLVEKVSDAARFDNFGNSVSISGDTLVVGAYRDDNEVGPYTGAVYVFTRSGSTWSEQKKLMPSPAEAGAFDWFGESVSVSGDTLLVGAPMDDNRRGTDVGAAYVSVRSGSNWTQATPITAAPWPEENFAHAVAIDGEYMVAGIPFRDSTWGNESGAVEVFQRVDQGIPGNAGDDAWLSVARLTPYDPGAGDRFGTSVSISGSTLVVGASHNDTDGGMNAGAAYVFTLGGGGWTQRQRLTEPTGELCANDHFGQSVSISGDTLVVGAFYDDEAATDAGAAYVFRWNGTSWRLEQKLMQPAGVAGEGDLFGSSVSISGDTLVVGAYADDEDGANAGAAYVFTRSGSTWSPQKLLGDDTTAADWFGCSVSISGDTLVVGARLDDHDGVSDAGAAYVFTRSGSTWSQEQKLVEPPDEATAGDWFGGSVLISAETLVVSAYADDNEGGIDAGMAYLFTRNGNQWTEVQKLQASDAAAYSGFGNSVAIGGDTLVIGASADDNQCGDNAGAAYVFAAKASGDADGVSDEVETTAPNGGDGNYDGVLDSAQGHITSLRSSVTSDYVTLMAPSTTLLANVAAKANPASVELPSAMFLDGFFDFRVYNVVPGQATTVTFQLPAATALESFYKYGPTPENPTPHHYEFLFDGQTGAEINGNSITVHYVDGQRGDDDLAANGIIAGGGAPVRLASIAFAQGTYSGMEDSPAGLSVTLSRAGNLKTTPAVTVNFAGGSAVGGGSDYDSTPIVAQFAADALTTTVVIPITHDSTVELDEVIQLTLVGPVCAQIGAQNNAALNVLNDDSANLQVHDAFSAEDNGGLMFMVTLTEDVDVPVTVDFLTVAGTGVANQDYLPVSGSLSFTGAAGETKTIAVPLVPDESFEADETFDVALTNVSASGRESSIATFAGTGTILNDDLFVEMARLTASRDATSDRCGSSVAIHGDYMVVGIPDRDTIALADTGAAHVYRRRDNGTPADHSDDSWVFEAQLTAADAAGGDRFGSSVSISGDTVVVGAPAHDTQGYTDAGAAYVFVRTDTTWSQQQELVQPDNELAAFDGFGHSVSISGNTLVIGAPREEKSYLNNTGAAYVSVRSATTWSTPQKVTASDAAANDMFGASVSVSGDFFVVGTPFNDNQGSADGGAAYVFRRSEPYWYQFQKLTESYGDAALSDRFGSSVSINGTTLVAGAPGDDARGTNAGATYVYRFSGSSWSQQQKLLQPSGELVSDDAFGDSVSLSANTLVVGAPADDLGSGNEGAAYVFYFNGVTWTQQQKLREKVGDATSNDYFGSSVAISADTLVVAAPLDDPQNRVDAGAAYVFERGGSSWTEVVKVSSTEAAQSNDELGTSVAVDGDYMVVGIIYRDIAGKIDSGAAQVFRRDDNGTLGVSADDVWVFETQLTHNDIRPGDRFGASVSISGETVAVGAPGHDYLGAADVGAVYIFARAGTAWNLQQKLLQPPSELSAWDAFGSYVSVSGNTLVVGATLDESANKPDAGAAYVFARSGTNWTIQQKLTASDAVPHDRFADSVSISGDHIVVGAPFGDVTGKADAGAAYVFARSGATWIQQQKLTAQSSHAAANDHFGNAVSISGTSLVVGAHGDNQRGPNAGAAYVFLLNGSTWSQQQKLMQAPGEVANEDAFGTSVSMTGVTLVVGASGDDEYALDAGAAYVFGWSGNTWIEQQKLSETLGNAETDDHFGNCVAISGDTLAVGAHADDSAWGLNVGAVHVFAAKGNGEADGISDAVEDAAPNNGDGNDDGIPDSQQANVASLPNALDGDYVTIASPADTLLASVETIKNPSPSTAPPGVEFPIGFFEFSVRNLAPGEATTVTFYLTPGTSVDTFYKFGPTPGNSTPHWYEFLYDGTTGAEIAGEQITLHLVDGARGDHDLTANGVILDPGAAAMNPTQVPLLMPIADQVVAELELFTFPVLTTEVEPSAARITFELDEASLAAGMSINADTGEFRWIPTENQGPGIYTVTVLAVEDQAFGRSDDETFTISVLEVNAPPLLFELGPLESAEGAELTFTAVATDIDVPTNSLTFSLEDAPAGATIDPDSGVFRWTPSDNGIFSFAVIVADGSPNVFAAQQVSVTVNNVAPALNDLALSVEENSPGGTVVGQVTATDPGADQLTYGVVGGSGAGLFTIDPDCGLVVVDDSAALDFETMPILTLEIVATDDDGSISNAATVTINLLNQASITGSVFIDVDQDGLFDANEPVVDAAIIELVDENGTLLASTTTSGGYYLFEDLEPGTYLIREVQPTGVTDGAEQLGTLEGTIVNNDVMRVTLDRTDAYDYCFAELGQQIASGDTASIGFWQNKHGQALINVGGTALANWLSNNFSNVFGNVFGNTTVADFYRNELFKQKSTKSAGPAKVDAQFMAVALATYFTSNNLAGNVAAAYGFNVTDTGIGTKVVNVGSSGAAFGTFDGTDLTVMQMLLGTNSLTDNPNMILGAARIYDVNGDGVIDAWEASLRGMANDVYAAINDGGGL